MDPRQQTDTEDEQFLLNIIAEGGGAQGDVPEQADDGSNTNIYLNMSGVEMRHHLFRMTLLVNKVLMYISQLYLLVLKIIFSFESI